MTSIHCRSLESWETAVVLTQVKGITFKEVLKVTQSQLTLELGIGILCTVSGVALCTFSCHQYQGSFFRRQNTEGLTLVGLFMEGTTLTCLETYSDAKKRTLINTQKTKKKLKT
jgi:hypothetical protein